MKRLVNTLSSDLFLII